MIFINYKLYFLNFSVIKLQTLIIYNCMLPISIELLLLREVEEAK